MIRRPTSALQRVVNGGRRIEREYGLGRGRTDLLVLWPREAGQPSDLWERFVAECKVLRDTDRKSLAWTVGEGVKQTLGYMKQCDAEEGYLVVMDRRTGAKERWRSKGAVDRRDGEGEVGGSGRRQDGRGVVVWTLQRIDRRTWTQAEGETIREAAPPSDIGRLASPPPAVSKTAGGNRRNNPALRGADGVSW